MQIVAIFRKGGNMQSIKRDIYLQRLKDREQNGLVKIITGIRRCGKSYLLNTLFYGYLKERGVKDDIKRKRDENGIVTMSIYDFLLDETSIEY